jgi:hypothetical protein
MYYQGFEPFRDDHTEYHTRLRSEVYRATADEDYQYASIASQFMKTNYDDFFIDY